MLKYLDLFYYGFTFEFVFYINIIEHHIGWDMFLNVFYKLNYFIWHL